VMRLAGPEFRIGFGADVRLNPQFTLSPMLMFSFGSFSTGTLVDHGGPEQSMSFLDASHGTVTFTLGGHFDLGG